MNKIIFFLLTSVVVINSCKKDEEPELVADYRDAITGNYSGIKVITSPADSGIGFDYDTTAVVLNISRSETDSLIGLVFAGESSGTYTFKYSGGLFTSTASYHPPTLSLVNDSLFFSHQPGLGPYWINCYTKKTN